MKNLKILNPISSKKNKEACLGGEKNEAGRSSKFHDEEQENYEKHDDKDET